ncbi:ArnT family glycosyltransferase [Runella slithyformis]|uniref:Glycosyl transferase family 39 n=1 Tax=Runella slithyformis (strain ATCC 29530 / DSM 19594 / LMG 11500 / NCIMB 11436 / LSU 4) TaxID=761193 RepID=A0A7U4E7N8_RUNSL|nr:glycosyltransferase family 39 protein [Runella slithyformis]AEI50853.1 glycosyl transferase family 39 [Runella slithyformis DSM 19594]
MRWNNKYLPFLGLLIVYVIGAVKIDIMDIDAAQYASIGSEMADNNRFLDVQFRGKDYYLDKPPLLFWISALIFKIFGVSNLTYRLVPILSTMVGMFALYRFCKLYYSERTAYIAALVMGSCQAFFLMNHDVRCDTLLTNCVILSIWQIAEYLKSRDWKPFTLGFVFAGLAMLAKGPISLIVIGSAFFVDFVLKRQWKNLFDGRWLLGILIIGLVLLPYCIGLYRQYGSEGLYFYFWAQSFGRITGESEWDNSPGLFFQAHNFLWSFLPWVLAFIPALYMRIREVVKNRFVITETEEALCLGGFVLPFVALSTAHYQLPHYTFVVFPLAAALTGRFLDNLIDQREAASFRWVRIGLIVTSSVMLVAIVGLCFWAFPLQNILLLAIAGLMTVLVVQLYNDKRPAFSQLVFAPFLTGLGINLLMNTHFYPTLMTYQSGSVIGKKVFREYKQNLDSFYIYDMTPVNEYNIFHSALDYYTQRTTPVLRSLPELKQKFVSNTTLIYTDELGLASINSSGLRYKVVHTCQNFHVTGLTLPFLNPALRSTETKPRYLLLAN